MQTFLPYPDFRLSAACLDNKRCFKQAVECIQLLNALTGKSQGWANHPATRMWRGHESSIVAYLSVLLQEWKSRGGKSPKCDEHLTAFRNSIGITDSVPPWADDDFCARHRSNLLRKHPQHYGQFGWSEPPTLEYKWPK